MGSRERWRDRIDRRILALIKQAEREGWTVTPTSKSHVRFKAPDGSTVICSGGGRTLDAHYEKTRKRLAAKGLGAGTTS